MSLPLVWVVEASEDGARLDVALSRRLEETRARSQQRLAAGDVTVAGEVAGKSRRLAAGERVAVAAPEPATPPSTPEPVPVRFADEHLAVIAKPAGLVVHRGAGAPAGTLVDALQAMGMALADAADAERPGIVHRLDRGTSGLLAVAKTDEAYRGLVAALSARRVQREYWALVDGVPDTPQATIDAPIARDPGRRTRFRPDPAGKEARTHYDVEERFSRAARLSLRLETGRTHQIRVHLSAIGHPVAADRLYGASSLLARELALDRPALHAGRLAFDHPVTGARVEVSEPLPADLQAALEKLRAAG